MSLMPFSYYPSAAGITIGSIDFELADSEAIESDTDISAIGTGDFTLEAWVKLETAGIRQAIMGIETRSAGGAAMYIENTNRLFFYIAANGYLFGTSGDISAGSWHHVAVTRLSGTRYGFLNGSPLSGSSVRADSVSAGKLIMSTRYAGAAVDEFDGKIALARWSNIARYTGAFTPAIDYGVDGDTVGFITSDGTTISESAASLALTTYGTPAADIDAPT